ncbi:MAG: 4'-phosphopantetheinyl transferase superfamily protein [Gammaproteobacteria bacterium]|nr:4'-phosphopantetheinyl transferase superfamily protein [Gammaproteobacteria bacterium]
MGKPHLAMPCPVPALGFNITHTRGCIGVAIGAGQDCGIDIEAISNVRDSDHLRHNLLTQDEKSHMATIPATQRSNLLARLWTLKEAYLKAQGGGLSTPPNTVGIATAGGVPVLDASVSDAHKWRLESFLSGENYQVALCLASHSKIDHIDNALVFLRELTLPAIAAYKKA